MPVTMVCHQAKQGLKKGPYAEAKNMKTYETMEDALKHTTTCDMGHSFGSYGHGTKNKHTRT